MIVWLLACLVVSTNNYCLVVSTNNYCVVLYIINCCNLKIDIRMYIGHYIDDCVGLFDIAINCGIV